MTKVLDIKNFKSVKALKLDCKRLNVFIGEPNTGKSNILESLGFLSYCFHGSPTGGTDNQLKAFVRYENTGNLFYDQGLENAIEVSWDAESVGLEFRDGGFMSTNLPGGSRRAHIWGDHGALAGC